MPVRTKKPLKKPESTIRIIAGQWRGRKLPVLDEDGLRPTGDRLRETLFSWLMPYLQDACVWDLYAGTGALGLEALSRGARSAKFIEFNARVAKRLRDNLVLLHSQESSTETEVISGDCQQWLIQHRLIQQGLKNHNEQQTFADIVFVDPPFSKNLWQSSIDKLETHPCLSQTAIIYVEKRKSDHYCTPANWQLLKSKNTGSICAQLFQRVKKETN